MIDVAIIDGKINKFYTNELFCVRYESSSDSYNLHATICYLIIKNNSTDIRVSNYEILKENNAGYVEDLEKALEWCLSRKIMIANLSFGSTHFLDFEKIRKTINYYANKGMILVVATSNNFFSTYPAKLSAVIGVAKQEYFFDKKLSSSFINHTGIDIIATSNHKINLLNLDIQTELCNSYAAPYVCKMISELVKKSDKSTLKKIKKDLCLKDFHEPFLPDWIDKAYVYGEKKKTDAKFYFNEVFNLYEADTIILCNNFNVDTVDFIGKNCVNLTEESIENFDENFFYWNLENRKSQIKKTKRIDKEFKIPVISIAISDSNDILFFLTEMKNIFLNNKYNIYLTSFDVNAVLYDIEFIPLEIDNVYSFLFWETYYNQSDILIIYDLEKYDNMSISVDIDIKIITTKLNHKCIIKYDNKIKELYFEKKISVQKLAYEIYDFLIKLLT